MRTPFHRYLELHLKLLDLIHEDKGDSIEADRIRDEMDDPWRAMTSAEHQLLEQVSCALESAEVSKTG